MNEVATKSASKIEAYVSHDGSLDLCPVVDAQEWIDDRIKKNEELDSQYVDYCEVLELDRDYKSALQFAQSLNGKGIYGDDSGPLVQNTYNGECLLSEVLQYIYWTDEDNQAHVLLQIQGGGDPRGNYPSPDAYDCTDYDGTAIFDNARGTIYCNDCDNYWDTDDAYHWGCDEERQNLEDYQASKDRPEYGPKPNPLQREFFPDLPPEEQRDSGIVWIDDDNQPHCPFCGGLLHVSFSSAQ
jgi:hypothetical protein